MDGTTFNSNQLTFDAIPTIGREFTDGHIRKINGILPGSLAMIGDYLRDQRQLSPQSLNTLAQGVKTSVKRALGDRVLFDLYMQFCLNAFFKQFYSPKAQFTEIQPVPEAEVTKLLRMSGPRTSLFFEWFYVTGCRVTETCGIRLRDIRPGKTQGENFVLLRETKGQRPRQIPAPAELIYRVLSVMRPKVFLFETSRGTQYDRKKVYWMLADSSRRILGYTVNPHLVRHSTAEKLVEKHSSRINAIAKHLGNSPAILVAKYNNNKLQQEDLPLQEPRRFFTLKGDVAGTETYGERLTSPGAERILVP